MPLYLSSIKKLQLMIVFNETFSTLLGFIQKYDSHCQWMISMYRISYYVHLLWLKNTPGDTITFNVINDITTSLLII